MAMHIRATTTTKHCGECVQMPEDQALVQAEQKRCEEKGGPSVSHVV